MFIIHNRSRKWLSNVVYLNYFPDIMHNMSGYWLKWKVIEAW